MGAASASDEPPFRTQHVRTYGFTMAPGMGGGVSAADFDKDGDIDLFVPTKAGTGHQLFENNFFINRLESGRD